VSNPIRYDSLLVRELAAELHGRLAGARLQAAILDRDRLRLTLVTLPARREQVAPPSLLWQLHPAAGHITAAHGASGEAGRIPLRARTPIVAVSAPPDERIIIVELAAGKAPPGAARRIMIELVTNQWNVVATGADDRIVSVLRERVTHGRELRTGALYAPPGRSARAGTHVPLKYAEWLATVGAVPPGQRLAALPRSVAWTGPLNAAWIIGDADVTDSDAALERAYHRYMRMADAARLTPVLLREPTGWQPYVVIEPGAAEVMPTLLQAFAEAAVRAEAEPAGAAEVEQALAAVAARLEAIERRRQRLEQERAGAADEAARLRLQAGLLLSQLHTVPRGAERVLLDDLMGGSVEVVLDPTAAPADNARRMYDTARRRDRAAARIPALLREAAREVERLEQLAGRIREGAVTPEELVRLQRRGGPQGGARRSEAAPLPYRVYRTRGGLEVRVGRGSRGNDELTFRHSHRDDIWLHARDAAGAHVILRWGRTDSNPAVSDIADAAVLAALHSRARTSGTVPVDWTRRKYVRKPRKAAPGLVLPERVRTIFVQPDASLAERLRVDDGLA
jgi:predicted ribosome quality control (RQC) complex YloA/Tae2 family protein